MFRTFSKPVRLLIWAGLSLALMALIAFNAVVVWVATGPRNITEYATRFEQEISASQDLFNIKITDVLLVWDGWQHPIDVRLKDIKFYTKQGLLFASFPNISIGVDIPSLFLGRLLPSSVTLQKPVINLYLREDGDISFDFGQEILAYGPYQPAQKQLELKPLAEMLKHSGLDRLFEKLWAFKVENATVNFGNTRQGIILSTDSVDIDATHLFGSDIDVTIGGNVVTGEKPAAFYVQASVPLKHFGASFKVTLDDFSPSTLATINPAFEELRGVHVPVNGWVNATFEKNGEPHELEFSLMAGEGKIQSDFFAEELPLTAAQLKGSRSKNGVLHIEKCVIQSGERHLNVQANIWNDAESRLGISVRGLGSHLTAEDINRFWPPKISPISREWVVDSIKKGSVPRATIEADILPEYHALDRMPDEAINAVIDFRGVTLDYMDGFPPLTDASGQVLISANTLTTNVTQGKAATGTVVNQGSFFIPDLNADNPDMKLNFEALIPMQDAAVVLATPSIDVAKDLHISKESVSGSAMVKAEVGFSFFAPRDEKGNLIKDKMATYHIQATPENVSMKQFLEQYDVTQASGALSVSNEKAHYNGKATVFGTPATLDVTHYMSEQQQPQTTVAVQTTAPVELLDKLGYSVSKFVSGSLAVEATIQQSQNSDTVEAKVDMTQASIKIPDIYWEKAAGVNAQLQFKAVSSAKGVDVEPATYSDAEMKFEGAVRLNPEATEVIGVRADKYTYGRSDTSFTYAVLPAGHFFHAKGKSLDVSKWLEEDEKEDDGFSTKDIPALDVDLELGSVYLDETRQIDQMKGTVKCNVQTCDSMDISGLPLGGKIFTATITRNGDKRQIQVDTEDAGKFLDAFDIYNNMIGGKLHITGIFNDGVATHPLTGTLSIWNFEISNAPALAKLLTLASFGGLLDTLQGKGITFEKLKAPFAMENDIINLKEVKNVGSSLGISADGYIQLDKNYIDIQGTVVPSYTINSFLRNVPLVGELLTGGEGIIAALYTMKGPLDDPSVSVNPLSVLTPGFLRGMFEGETPTAD